METHPVEHKCCKKSSCKTCGGRGYYITYEYDDKEWEQFQKHEGGKSNPNSSEWDCD